MKAVLYIGHGTRLKKGAEEAKAFIQNVMQRIDVPIQEIGFLELTEPLIEEGFRTCVEKGATEISVVPLFLLAAGHIKQDIPLTLSALQEKYPHVQVKVREPFGVHEGILDALAEFVRETAGNVEPQDRLLIVGRGSSDPGIQADFEKIALGIKERLGIDAVSVCYLAAAQPRLNEGMEAIIQPSQGKVIVLPYLLFSGLLFTEVNEKVRKLQQQGLEILHTGPLSANRIFEDIIITRVGLN
jgi:sirohydrochlorin ferrochelatase